MGATWSNPHGVPPLLPADRSRPDWEHVIEISAGYFHVRADFKVAKGLVNLTTHMSLCRLESGDFVAIDCVDLTGQDELKAELDELTEGGTRLAAVLNTHPYHSLGIDSFHAAYPAVGR